MTEPLVRLPIGRYVYPGDEVYASHHTKGASGWMIARSLGSSGDHQWINGVETGPRRRLRAVMLDKITQVRRPVESRSKGES